VFYDDDLMWMGRRMGIEGLQIDSGLWSYSSTLRLHDMMDDDAWVDA